MSVESVCHSEEQHNTLNGNDRVCGDGYGGEIATGQSWRRNRALLAEKIELEVMINASFSSFYVRILPAPSSTMHDVASRRQRAKAIALGTCPVQPHFTCFLPSHLHSPCIDFSTIMRRSFQMNEWHFSTG